MGLRKAGGRILFLVLQVFFVVIAAEVTLHAASLLSPRVQEILAEQPRSRAAKAMIDDPILGHRPSPGHPGHDSRGFRNAEACDEADIVVLGDSQTYGSGVELDEAWPARLQGSTNLIAYNYAFPGYGPTHSLAMMNEALALSPKIVIEAFYSGNDLYDCFNMVHKRRQLPELASTDPEVLAELKTTMESGSVEAEVNQLLAPSGRTRLREFLAAYSKTWAAARAVARFRRQNSEEVMWRYWRNNAESSNGTMQALDSNGHRTVLTPTYRLVALDLDDPRIAEGQRIALASLRQMSEKSPERFLVLLIPTKELVFADLVAEAGGAARDYSTLVKYERKHWDRTREFLDTNGIQYVDALPILSQALAQGVKVYPHTNGGHPTAAGQAAISQIVRTKLEELDWLADLPKTAER